MNWVKADKNTIFKTGDILCIKTGKNRELAFIDSGLTTGFPTCISSIPDGWSYDFDEDMQEAVFPRFKEYEEGVRLGTTRIKNIYGDYIFTIEKYLRINLKGGV